MRDGALLRGWGMATETYPAKRLPAGALVRFQPNGRILVASGTHELGTGMYTVLAQVAAESLGLSPDLIDAQLGDTVLPQAPISAGSMSVASVTPAVQLAAGKARLKLLSMATEDARSPVHGARVDELDFKDGRIFLKRSPAVSEHYIALLERNGNPPGEASARTRPNENDDKYSAHSFGAVFTEVTVDSELGIVRMPKVVAVYDVGRLLNEKTGKSQFIGGIVGALASAA